MFNYLFDSWCSPHSSCSVVPSLLSHTASWFLSVLTTQSDCWSPFHPLALPQLFFNYKLGFFFRLLPLCPWIRPVLVAWLGVNPLQLPGTRVKKKQSGDLTQDGVVLLETRDPLVERGLVALVSHTHGEYWALLNWIHKTQDSCITHRELWFLISNSTTRKPVNVSQSSTSKLSSSPRSRSKSRSNCWG